MLVYFVQGCGILQVAIAHSLNSNLDKPWLFASITDSQALIGDVVAAKESLELIADEGAQAFAMSSITAAHMRAGRVEQARATMARLLKGQDASAIAKLKHAKRSSILDGLVSTGQVKFAVQIARQIEDQSSRTSRLSDIAYLQREQGDPKGALQTLKLMEAEAHGIKEVEARADALISVARQRADCGDKDGAKNTLMVAAVAAEKISGFVPQSLSLADIVREQAELGDFKAAAQTTGKITYSRVRQSSQIAIVDALAKAGKPVGREFQQRADMAPARERLRLYLAAADALVNAAIDQSVAK